MRACGVEYGIIKTINSYDIHYIAAIKKADLENI